MFQRFTFFYWGNLDNTEIRQGTNFFERCGRQNYWNRILCSFVCLFCNFFYLIRSSLMDKFFVPLDKFFVPWKNSFFPWTNSLFLGQILCFLRQFLFSRIKNLSKQNKEIKLIKLLWKTKIIVRLSYVEKARTNKLLFTCSVNNIKKCTYPLDKTQKTKMED